MALSLIKEFKAFALKGNIVDLAIAVVIGGAFGKIVSAFVDDLIMPIVGNLLPGGAWRTATITPVNLQIGHFLGAVLDFLIVSIVVFLTLVKLLGVLRKSADAAAAAPTPPATKSCAECLETIPAAARRCRACASVVATAAIVLLWAPAAVAAALEPTTIPDAAGQPPQPAKPAATVEWKVQAKGGLVLTTGNARTTTGTINASASRKKNDNKLAIEAGAAYARSQIIEAVDDPAAGMPGLIEAGEIRTEERTITNAWFGKARYDRFFTANNTGYTSAQIAGDRPAGKLLVGGGQAGYSRQLYKSARHLALAEAGYDFSYERYLPPPGGSSSSVNIHSARVFLGETLTLSKDTGVVASAELLLNLNQEKEPAPGYGTVSALNDVRIVGKAGLTTTLLSNVSFGFGFTLKYDNVPAPRAPFKLPFAPGFFPRAQKTDTITEASLIVTFL